MTISQALSPIRNYDLERVVEKAAEVKLMNQMTKLLATIN